MDKQENQVYKISLKDIYRAEILRLLENLRFHPNGRFVIKPVPPKELQSC